jgi:hypothetical protein
MPFLPAENFVGPYGQAVDLAARLPTNYLSQMNVFENNSRGIGISLSMGPASVGSAEAAVRSHILNAIDGLGLAIRAEQGTAFPDGTPVYILPYNQSEYLFTDAVPAALPEKTIAALQGVHSFIGASALLPVSRLITKIWAPARQNGNLTQRISTSCKASYATQTEYATVLSCVGKAKKVLRFEWSEARPRVLPSYIWELELPKGGQTFTLTAANMTPEGVEQEKDAARKGAGEPGGT